MSKRALTVSIMTAGLTVGVVGSMISPAAAQGNPVGGAGNVFYLSGAQPSINGQAQQISAFGDRNDVVYFGDWYGQGVDQPMVRRGNLFYVPTPTNNNQTQNVFAYGDVGDVILVGDWDGDGQDSLAVRRGNRYLVKNDVQNTGKADADFFYGEANDTVLVGNWDGVSSEGPFPGFDANGDGDFTDPGSPGNAADIPREEDEGFDDNGNGDFTDPGDRQPGTGVDNNKDGDFNDPAVAAVPADIPPTAAGGDSLMIQRGNTFFVKNSTTTGKADYTFNFGDAGDQVIVGDWASQVQPETADSSLVPAESGDGADQLAVRRGNTYFQSSELAKGSNPITQNIFTYGNVNDTVFVAALPSEERDQFGRIIEDGDIITGDGLGVRR